ncbi:unnamed protein product, partial [Protopolystoma xenopodis]
VITCDDFPSTSGYDTRADVWSLGVTGLELWDGEPPLAGISPMRALARIPQDPTPILAYPCLEQQYKQRRKLTKVKQQGYLSSLADEGQTNEHPRIMIHTEQLICGSRIPDSPGLIPRHLRNKNNLKVHEDGLSLEFYSFLSR